MRCDVTRAAHPCAHPLIRSYQDLLDRSCGDADCKPGQVDTRNHLRVLVEPGSYRVSGVAGCRLTQVKRSGLRGRAAVQSPCCLSLTSIKPHALQDAILLTQVHLHSGWYELTGIDWRDI